MIERVSAIAVTTQHHRPAAPRSFPPGPPLRRRGVLGNLRYYYNFITDPFSFVGGRFRRYGDIYYAPNADGGLYVIRHPDHIREVLATRSSKFDKSHSAFDRLSVVLGDGLLTADGDVWKRQRRMVQPAFHRTKLAAYGVAMTSEALRRVGTWRDGEVLDMSCEMIELTMRVVAQTLFTHDVSGETDEVRRAMTALISQMSTPDVLPEWVPNPRRTGMRAAVAALDRIIYGMIERRREVAAADAPTDLLQMLVTAVDEDGDGTRMTEKEVRDQLVTLFLAGHETTSHALTWTLYLLSQNYDAERKLHAEVDRVLCGRVPTVDDLEALPFTQQVIKESMRLYPPAFMVARRANADSQIGEYSVAKGSEVAVWIYMTHRDPRWYPRPLEFRPERFAPEAAAKLPKMAYLPFGGGPRACIGAQFALIEAQLLLAVMAQRCRFELVPGHKVAMKPRITLAPKHGMRMTVHRRRVAHTV